MARRIARITLVDIVVKSHNRHIFIQPGSRPGSRDDAIGAERSITIQAGAVQWRSVAIDDKSRDAQAPAVIVFFAMSGPGIQTARQTVL